MENINARTLWKEYIHFIVLHNYKITEYPFIQWLIEYKWFADFQKDMQEHYKIRDSWKGF
jgi:hypothetical protein